MSGRFEANQHLADSIRPDARVRTEALGRLAAGIAHDLNGMLAGIGATAELLARRASPKDCEALQAIGEQTGRAAALIRQLLAFAREEEISPAPLDLALLVERLSAPLEARAGGVRLELALEAAPAFADALAVERVLINIVANALQALGESHAGGRIQLSTAALDDLPEDAPFVRPGRYALLTVADDGPGIPAAIAHRIFEPYFTTRAEGHGLGLSSAFGLVKQQRGYLLHDCGPLGGARFRILLPAEPPLVE